MMKYENLCYRIYLAMSLFSPKITNQVDNYFYDEKEDKVFIILLVNSDIKQFCHLLDATGLFTEDDEFRVIFKK